MKLLFVSVLMSTEKRSVPGKQTPVVRRVEQGGPAAGSNEA